MSKLKFLAKILPDIFLHKRLFYALLATVFLFCLGFPYPLFVVVGKIGVSIILLSVIGDMALLYSVKSPIKGSRIVENKLSNGDFNPIIIQLNGKYSFMTHLEVIDEFPPQLQLRNKTFKLPKCRANFAEEIVYEIRPQERGVYTFSDIRVFISSPLRLIKRRITVPASKDVKVYPSFIQYRKYAFLAISNRLEEVGIKKVRQLGASNEFEQIREYVRGDDFRNINWKATARRNDLMVNQYQEEKAQNVYCLIDKGRLMHMPFEGLSLIDYSINASLVLSGIAIGRGDKSGLITFSDKIGTFIQATSKTTQMNIIADALYDQEVRLRETDFLRLYKNAKSRIKKRSFFILFTNFDSQVTLNRQIKYLKALNRHHLLLVVIFDNSEINERANLAVQGINEVYKQTIAEKFQQDKRLIIKELKNNGIYSILTEPQELTINTINKYIEIKARGAI